jgi:Nucleotidyltransferase of unknown function (DUF6036)
MNSLIQALQIIVRFFESQRIPYMLVGGLANSIYGIPRQTFDIDIKLVLEEHKSKEFFSELVKVAAIIPADPLTFLHDTGVIPVEIAGVRIDLVNATLPYEQESFRRIKKEKMFGIEVMVTSAEDLIIQKAISPRNKDWLDIEGIIENMGKNLDWTYILFHVKQLSGFLTDSGIYSRIEKLKDAAKL